MSLTPLSGPRLDPTSLFDLVRGNFATEILAAAVTPFNVFGRLAAGPMTTDELRRQLDLAPRPAAVLLTGLRAMGLLAADLAGQVNLTDLAREHLVPGGPLDVSGYIGLTSELPGVRMLVERLRSNRPADVRADEGAAFIYREGLDSAMEQEASARRLTLALAGRARIVAPILAERVPLGEARLLLDVGGGTGLFSIACLRRWPNLRALVWDRPEVLKVAAELAATHGVADRLECRPGDMFRDTVPAGADVHLLSNVLHDWDVPECETLLSRCVAALPAGGRLLIHDAFLDDALDGPLPVALYSAALFSLTEGRAYSAGEYRTWLDAAGLRVDGSVVPTLVHCGVLTGRLGV